MLNNVLTVRRGEPASHKGRGWEQFTDAVIDALDQREEPVCFVLWGKHAQVKGERINTPSITSSLHLIQVPSQPDEDFLEASPSPKSIIG